MKILVTGCKGQLGVELAKQIKDIGSFQLVETDLHNLDIVNAGQVQEFLNDAKPQVVINCAAFTNVDACEGEDAKAFRINALGALNLSAAAYRVGAKFLQVSTDYVFDGTGSTPKKEFDPVNPRNIYGKSKAWGEQLVRESNPRHFIVRTAWLFGEGRNFVRTVLELGREKGELRVVDDQVGSPTSTVDLAGCILRLIQTEAYGTYHGTCEGACSWYEFTCKIFERCGFNIRVDRATTEEMNRAAVRPKFSVLDNYRLKLMGMNSFRHWEEALEEYLKGGKYL